MNETLFLKANALLRKGHFKKALDLYKEIIDADPNNALAHQNASVVLGDLGDYPEALIMSSRALEIDVSLVIPHITMAYLNDKLGNKEASREEARIALAKAPEMPEALSCIGILLLMDNRSDEAKHYLDKAVKINPSFYLAQDYLARVYQFRNDWRSHLQQLLIMFRLKPNVRNLFRLTFFASRLYKFVHLPILLLSAFLSLIFGTETILVFITSLLMIGWFIGGIYIGLLAEKKQWKQAAINILVGIGIGVFGLIVFLSMNYFLGK